MEYPRRKAVLKYGREIEELTQIIRRWISEQTQPPGKDEIRRKVEDEYFESELSGKAQVYEIRTLIGSIYDRVCNKYGILSRYLSDPFVSEIMVNGPSRIFIEINREIEQVDDAFASEEELEEIIRMLAADVHREINEANPIVDARLPSGYRVNGVLKNIALNGPTLTIRKFRDKEISMNDLIEFGSITSECAEDLKALVRSGYNIFISGGTSSGKTTFLNALTAAIHPRERVIIIEDSAELMITHLTNRVHLECRSANSIGKGEVTMEMLIRTSLRMRPDRIIVGEVRGREVVDMIQAMNTGHDGSMSTGHGNSIKGMLGRLETMYLMDSAVSVDSVRNQIANAVDVFVHLRRDPDGRRRVWEVAELAGYENGEYDIRYLYTTGQDGKLVKTENGLLDRDRLIRAKLPEMVKGKSA